MTAEAHTPAGPPQGTATGTAATRPQQLDGLVLPWSWCRCCQRAFVKGTYRQRQSVGAPRRPGTRAVQECPYLDCWGEILRDSRPWASIRHSNPGYPEQPERYVVYAYQPDDRA